MSIETNSLNPNHSSTQMISIRSLSPEQSAVVASVRGNSHDVARLAEMGLRKGVVVSAVRQGATSIIKIEFQSICIRLAADVEILVTPNPTLPQ